MTDKYNSGKINGAKVKQSVPRGRGNPPIINHSKFEKELVDKYRQMKIRF